MQIQNIYIYTKLVKHIHQENWLKLDRVLLCELVNKILVELNFWVGTN